MGFFDKLQVFYLVMSGQAAKIEALVKQLEEANSKLLEENPSANKVKPINSCKSILITPEQLVAICTKMNLSRATVMAEMLNRLASQYAIKTVNQFEEFLANVLQESDEFTHRIENMNYSAQRMAEVWPARYALNPNAKSKVPNEKAKSLAKAGPQAIANDVYGGRMGNNGPVDGWLFRGGGFIGLTGKAIYEAFAIFKGFKTPEEAANYVRDSDYGALDSAFWFFCVLKNLIPKAEKDDFVGIVKGINGGTIGMKDREFYYKRIKEILK